MSADLVSNQYYAVIFTSKRTEIDGGYKEMLEKMVELAKQQPGFLGIESVKEKLGISVSYWKDLASIGTIMLNMLMQGKKEEKIGIRNFMFELQKLRGNIVLQKKSKN